MKYFGLFLISILIALTSFAQIPHVFKYQAVIRDASGDILANQLVSFEIAILKSNVTGSTVYTETHTSETNQFGLVTFEIGNGTTSDDFTAIDWDSDKYFIKISVDPTGGTSYEHMGTTQLLSVPYALHAKTVENNDDADADPENEIQSLSLSNDTLSICKSNFVKLPYCGTLWAKNGNKIYYNNGNVGIGTNNPNTMLEIIGNDLDNCIPLIIKNNASTAINLIIAGNTDYFHGGFTMKRSRGTFDNPVDLIANDRVGGMYGRAFFNNDYWVTSSIEIYIGDNPGINSYPSNIRFLTTSTGSTVRKERMRISENGNVGIGTSDPGYLLDIQGNADVSSITPRQFVCLHNKNNSIHSNVAAHFISGTGINEAAGSVGVTAFSYIAAPSLEGYTYLYSNYSGIALRARNSEGIIKFITGGNDVIHERMRITANGNIGIGTKEPKAKLHVKDGDIYINCLNKGIIMKSPDGQCWRVTVENDGSFLSSPIACPE